MTILNYRRQGFFYEICQKQSEENSTGADTEERKSKRDNVGENGQTN